MKKKNQLPEWVLWLFGWLLLFGVLTYLFLGPIQQSVMIKVGPAELVIEGESEKVTLGVVCSFFSSIIIIALIWGIVRIYEIKSMKKRR